jgi:poly-gamma-glutamate synthesis protein (capsule biosynthesis protein)
MIDRRLRPEILRAGDPRFAEMLRYMEWASEDFAHRFVIEGDEIAISG